MYPELKLVPRQHGTDGRGWPWSKLTSGRDIHHNQIDGVLASSLLPLVLACALLLGSSGAPVAVYADQDAPPGAGPQDVSAAVFSAPASYIVHGAHISPVSVGGGGPREYYQEIAAFNTDVGKNVGIVMYFRVWDSVAQPCDNGYLPGFVDGAGGPPGTNPNRAIMITWEPTPTLANPGPSKYDNILNGSYDSLITNCANQLKAWSNKKFLLRFMHEMNIPQSPWAAQQSYNQKPDGTGDTAKFIQVWQYVHNKFVAAGATNVEWVWAPNYGSTPNVAWNDINNYYPGDAYVDWIGLSGYNWYPFLGYSAPSTYSEIYDAVLTDLQCRYAKPIVHNEIGSTDSPAMAKTTWLTAAYQNMRTYPLVRGVVWFNDYAYHDTSQADFRVWTNSIFAYSNPGAFTSVPASVTTAYATAVGNSAFTSTFNSSVLLNPPMTRCPSDSVSANGVLGARPASDVVARSGLTAISFKVGALGLASNTTFTVSGCPSNVTCTFASSGTSTSTTRTAPWSADTLDIVASPSAVLGTVTLAISEGGTSTTVQLTVLQTIQRVFLPNIQK